jgi:signal recognition particle subunit SRP54
MGSLKNVQVDEKALARTEAIILSMTPYERENPSVLNHSRKQRISAGAGVKVEQINQLLKQFDMMQSLVKQMTATGKRKKKFKGLGMGFGGGGGRGGFNIPGF